MHSLTFFHIYKRSFLLLFILIFTGAKGQSDFQYPVKIKGRNFEFIDSTLVASDKALGGNIFFGKAFYYDKLKEHFSDPILFGIQMDFHKRQWVFQINGNFGFGKTKKEMLFPGNIIWEKNKFVLSTTIGIHAGYSVYDNSNFKIVPIGGIDIRQLDSYLFKESPVNKYEPYLPYLQLGFYIDFKSLVLLQEHIRINNEDENYTSLRLSGGISLPIGTPRYENYFKGQMIYISLGMGGLSRHFSRK